MGQMAIGEVAGRAGVATSAIRYYEEIGLLPEAERVNGRRRYDAAVLEKLGLIGLAQRAGFTIAEIKTLLHDFPIGTPPSTRWEVMAKQKLIELDERIQKIQAMKSILAHTLVCQCGSLEECGASVN